MPSSMFNFLKQPRRLIYVINYFFAGKNHRLTTATRPFANYSSQLMSIPTQNRNLLLSGNQVRLVVARNKSKGRKTARKFNEEESSDEEDELEDDEDDVDEKDVNVRSIQVNSLRIDTVLKSALNTSRRKIEECFYENRIRLNGRIVNKKSVNACLSDEIDLIVGCVKNSLDEIHVQRVKILKVDPNPENEKVLVKVWRVKSLKIANYPDGHPWKQPMEEN